MAIATAPRPTGRGRQPAQIEAQRDYRDDLTAERTEARLFAARVAYLGELIHNGGIVADDFGLAELGKELQGLADRRLRQIGPVPA